MDIKDFLAQDEIRELIAENDLEAVYDRYYPLDSRKDLSEYLIDLGINPVNYFKKSIPEAAFAHCTNSTSIVIPDNITSIGQFAFYGCSGLTSAIIGNGVTSIGSGAFSGCTSLTSVTIPDSVTSIGYGTFEGCTGLTSITIPDSVTSFGGWAFAYCTSLTEITYSGTREQWRKIKKHREWRQASSLEVIHYADGDIELK